MSTIAQTVGQRLRFFRQQQGMTQEKLAEKSDLHHTYIGQIERGEKNLTLSSLEKILNALNISFSDLFEYMEPCQKDKSIPAQCYDLISQKSKSDQLRLYRILCEIEYLMND